MSGEPPVYRPFALLAFASTVALGTPLGLRLLAWRFLGASALSVEWVLLHAHLQTFGFFATLIVGVAPHLLARFSGRPLSRRPLTSWLAPALGLALILRVAGTWSGSLPWLAVAAVLQGTAFAAFGAAVWRALDPAPLRLLRRHLTASSGWLAVACLGEAWLWSGAWWSGAALPDVGALRAVQATGLLGGVVGWVLGVLLRAGPMFVASWRVSPWLARVMPWAIGLGVVLVTLGETTARPGPALARTGEALVLCLAAAFVVSGGVLRRGGRGLPMLARSPQEARIFRVAGLSVMTAALGLSAAAALAWTGGAAYLVTDAARHLVTVGFLTSVVVAMTFRLVPVLEWRPLPWPRLREVAFWTLAAGVALRTAEVLVPYGGRSLALGVALSGALVWAALVCTSATLTGALARRRPTA